MAEITSLIGDIHKLLGGHDLSESIDRFRDGVGEMLVRRFKEHGIDRKPSLRMSNVGKPLRQLWYELKGYKAEELSPETKFKFLWGDLTETLVLFLAEVAGHKVERLQEEIEVDGVIGHIDAVIDGVLFDVKSCSSRSFDKFKDGSLLEPGNDPFGYVAQLSGYSQALGLPAAWLAVDKTLGKICILELPKSDKYDINKRIADVRIACSLDTPPERCYEPELDGKSGNEKLSVGCSYCGYKLECWKDANNNQGLKVYSYSTGPRYLTKVVREPKVFQVNGE